MLIEFHRKMLADHARSAAFEAALRQVIRPGETTLADIGAGTGVLAFMAQRLGAREVHLIERGAVIELAALRTPTTVPACTSGRHSPPTLPIRPGWMS